MSPDVEGSTRKSTSHVKRATRPTLRVCNEYISRVHVYLRAGLAPVASLSTQQSYLQFVVV